MSSSFPSAIAAIALLALHPGLRGAQTQPPNILWIITDDQRADSISAFNRMMRGKNRSNLGTVISPNVDRLAAIGTTFINTFNQNPGCAPSRTSMHTGRYPHRTGIYGFEYYNPTGMAHWRPMTPEVLREQAGYQTIAVGKQGIRAQHFAKRSAAAKAGQPVLYETDLGYRNEFDAAKLTEWHPKSEWINGKQGPKSEIFYLPDGGQLVWPEKAEAPTPDIEMLKGRYGIFRAYLPDGKTTKGEDGGLGEIIGGQSTRPGDQTRDYNFASVLLDHLNHAGQKYTDKLGRKQTGPNPAKPVFAYCGFEFPHTPVTPPAEFREQFAHLRFDVPPFTEAEKAQFPPQIRRLFANWETNHFTDAEKQQMIRDYYAYCAYGDTLVGKLADGFIAFSEQQGRPWLLLYVCGDHGWKLNEHGMASKFTHYDTDLHNPVIVVSSDKQRFPAGKVVTDFTQFVDLAPTFLAAAGIDISQPAYAHLDGRDLAATASGKLRPRDYIIAEPTWVIGPRAVIRSEDYKFAMKVRPQTGFGVSAANAGKNIDWAMQADLKDIEPTLYDLRVDPDERHNLAFDPHYRPVLDALRAKLQNIVLGDGRVEVPWSKNPDNRAVFSNFAPGADDGRLDLPILNPKKS